MVIRDAQAIKLGSTTVNKIYYGTDKVYDVNKTALEGYCIQNGEPTPDNPIEIETMKGRQIIPIEKINIISTDVNDWEGGQYNQTNGAKSNDGHRIRMKELVPVEPGVYYVNTFTKEYNIILRTYDENKTFISSIGNVTNGTTITVTTARYISVTLWKYGNSSISYTELLQKISDKEITPYICLDSAKYVVDLKSKNLLNPTRTWENFNGTTLTLSNQQLTLNGTSTAPTAGKITDTAISSGTYTVTFKEISGSHTSGKLLYIDLMNGNTKVTGISFSTDSQQTITLSNNIDNIKFGFQASDVFSNYTFVIQLEQGSTPTTYEPYYDYELAGIDTYKDTIFTREGKWYKGNKISKVILDGTEIVPNSSDYAWSYYTSTNKPVFYMRAEVLNYKTETGLLCFCDYFRGYGQVYSFDNVYDLGNYAIALRTQYKRVVIRFDSKTTLNSFKEWLGLNNITVYYALETPTEEQITAPGLIAQLNALYQAM